MTNPHDDSEVSFSDVLEYLKSKKRYLLIFSILGAFLAFLIALFRSPVYEGDSSFREKNQSLQMDQNKSSYLSQLIGGNNLNEGALSTLKSRKLIEQVVLKRNLQARIYNLSKWEERFTYPSKNLKLEYAYLTHKLEPVIVEQQIPLIVDSLFYDEEIPTVLNLKMTSEDTFSITDQEDNEIGIGSLNKPFETNLFSFTLAKNNDDSIAHQEFHLELMPLSYIVEIYSSQLVLEQDPLDKNLVLLVFRHPDRQVAVGFLNDLMETYQQFLRDDQKRISEEQLTYLNERQERIEQQLRTTMEKHAQTLSSNTANMDLLIQNQENYSQKLIHINLELSRLANVKKEGTAYYDRSGVETGDSVVINGILNEIRSLKQQEETLRDNPQISKGEDLAIADEFTTLDLPTANQLYTDQCKGFNHLEGECRQQEFVLEQLNDPNFEITSLSTIQQDQVCHDIIARAIQIELMLNDNNNRTAREMARLREELEQQKKFLHNHVQESHRIIAERKKYTLHKIGALQSHSHNLIDKKIKILKKQLADYVDERIKTLVQEKNTLKTQQLILQKELQKLPAKWAAQKVVEQQLATNKTLTEELTSMVESKLISANIDISQSGPLDSAYSHIHPRRPHLILFTFMGAIGGFLVAMTWLLLKIKKKNGQILS